MEHRGHPFRSLAAVVILGLELTTAIFTQEREGDFERLWEATRIGTDAFDSSVARYPILFSTADVEVRVQRSPRLSKNGNQTLDATLTHM
jgi:hypothetical protein